MKDDLFPTIKKSIETLIEDQEGNIPANKLLVLGTMMVVLGGILSVDAFAAHSSHRSHSSHSSHSSGTSSYHESHVSHQSHESHSSGSNYYDYNDRGGTSGNANTHSNSTHSSHSSGPDITPGDVHKVNTAISATDGSMQIKGISTKLQTPDITPATGVIPAVATPASMPETHLAHGENAVPPVTESVE